MNVSVSGWDCCEVGEMTLELMTVASGVHSPGFTLMPEIAPSMEHSISTAEVSVPSFLIFCLQAVISGRTFSEV